MALLSYFRRPTPNKAFDQRLNASVYVAPIAELLYTARGLWIGGEVLEWDELTAQQKHDFRLEIESLIKGEQQ
jgi:hypothetical protein